MDKIKKRSPPIPPDIVMKAVRNLFPMQPRRDETTIEVDKRDIPEVTLEEITEAGNKIAAGKAPESDGVPPEVVKMLIKRWPRILQKLANDILRRGKFPDIWKEANLVLIPKPGNKTGPTAFRPICLLNTAAKAIERIIVNRLNKEIEHKEALSETQYGFRKHRSTMPAVDKVLRLAREEMRSTLKTRELRATNPTGCQKCF